MRSSTVTVILLVARLFLSRSLCLHSLSQYPQLHMHSIRGCVYQACIPFFISFCCSSKPVKFSSSSPSFVSKRFFILIGFYLISFHGDTVGQFLLWDQFDKSSWSDNTIAFCCHCGSVSIQAVILIMLSSSS